jgi:hypothetical protein
VPALARLILLLGTVPVVVLLLAGCGGGGSDMTASTSTAVTDGSAVTPKQPTPESKQATPGSKQVTKSSPGDPCQSRVGSFVASMDSLRRRLAVGVTYDQYVAEVRGIRSTYEKIPADRVEIDCLTAVGAPAERAFNRYIEAADDWGECVSEAGCSSATVEPVLQRRWRIASHLLSGADEALEASAP